jgi:hypothetical protein
MNNPKGVGMPSNDQHKARPEYIGTNSLNATKYYTAFAAAIPVLGGAAMAIAKWAGSGISDTVVVGVMGVVAAGLISMGLVVSADVRARATAKAATARDGSDSPAEPAQQDSKPWLQLTINSENAKVEGGATTPAEPKSS